MTLAKKNYLHNSQAEITGIIHSQHKMPVAGLRFGIGKMSFNGCGIVAVYNCLLLCGVNAKIYDVAYFYEHHGRWLWGIFGIRPDKITGFFKTKKLKVLNQKIKDANEGVFLLTVWNKGGGLHYIAIKKTECAVFAYNAYGIEKYTDFSDFFNKTKAFAIRLYKII